MNDVEKWTGGRSSDRGVAEIVILLTLLIFVVFGFVFYFFYQKVTELSEQVENLQQQVVELTNTPQRLVNPEDGGDFQPVYVEKWAPPGSNFPVEDETVKANDEKQGQQGDSFRSTPSVTPKEVSTFRVRPDGTIADTPKSADPINGSKKNGIAERSTTSQSARHNPADEVVIGDIKVQLKQCELKRLFLYCDLRIRSSTEVVRDIQIANKGSFVSGEDGAVYRVSSFRIGAMGDRQNYRSMATISRSLPLDVQYAFYLPNRTKFVLKEVQFNIAGKAFGFDGTALEIWADEGKNSDGTGGAATLEEPAVVLPQRIADIEARLLGCGDGGNFYYCDIELHNLGSKGRGIQVSYENAYLESGDYHLKATSFSIGKAGEKLHHQFEAFISKGLPLTLRYRFDVPFDRLDEADRVQFNIDERRIAFNNIRVDGKWSVNQPPQGGSSSGSPGSKALQIQAFRHKKSVGNIAVDLQYCVARRTHLYCDLRLINFGEGGREVSISKDNTFVRTFENASYRFTSLSVGRSKNEAHHHVKTYLHKGRPVLVRFRMYGSPKGVDEYKLIQFNIDGQNVVFEDVQTSS